MDALNAVAIGSGFFGPAAATYLASKGFKVDLFEKNSTPGGRARKFDCGVFSFDIGPSWYWMPEVFDPFLPGLAKNQNGGSPSSFGRKNANRQFAKGLFVFRSYIRHILNML